MTGGGHPSFITNNNMESINEFSGGLNWDWSPTAIGPDKGKSPFQRGDYRYMLNMRGGSSEADNTGAVENIRGDVLIDNVDLPAGINTTIGSTLDRKNRKLYYYVHNDNSDHGIYCYNITSNSIITILIDSALNFDLDHLINGSYVRDNLLYFTDNYNPPRQVDTVVLGTLSTVSEFSLSLIKYRPSQPLRITSVDQVGGNEFTEKGVYQFTYRYVYINGMKSRCAPFTSIFTNEYFNSEGAGVIQSSWDKLDIYSRGHIFNSIDTANPILHNNSDILKLISKVEVLMKESDELSWQLIKSINVNSLPWPAIGSFNNSSRFITVSDSEVNDGQDYVPLLSEGLESIDNRIFLSNNLEDFPEVTNFEIEGQAVYQADDNTWASTDSAKYPSSAQALANRFKHNRSTFKAYGVYQIGVIFHDEAGRTSLTYTDDTCRFMIDSTNDGVNYFSLGFKFASTFTPPDWATSYQIVRSNCLNMSYFIEGVVDGIIPKKEVTTDGVTTDQTCPFGEASKLYFDIKNWNSATEATDPVGNGQNPLNNVYYTFAEGHRIRFFQNATQYDFEVIEFKNNSLVISRPNTDVTVFNKVHLTVYAPKKESENIVFYETGEWYPILNPKTPNRSWSKDDWTWTDNQSISTVTLHNGDNVYNKYPFLNGDVHRLFKRFYITHSTNYSTLTYIDTSIQSMNTSPLFISGVWQRGNGRPNIGYIDPPKQLRRSTQYRFSGKFVTDGVLNYANKFDFPDQYIYPEEYGSARKIINANNQSDKDGNEVLLGIHEHETISIYINRVLIQDTAGTSQLGLSERVLGSYNTLLGSYGTINPESVVAIDGRAYYWDGNKGNYIRYSRDGLTPISAVFMRNYFNDICQALVTKYTGTNNPRVLSCYDYYHDELIVNFNHSSLPATFKGYDDYKTILFNEEDNRWREFLSLQPEHMSYINNFIVSFKDGGLYIHGQGDESSFGTFHGTKYDSKIALINNESMVTRKVFEAIRVVAEDMWSVESSDTDKVSGSKTRQTSNIPLTEFKDKEGDYYASFNKDINSNTSNPIKEGDNLRGKYIEILLKLDPSVDYLTAMSYIQVKFSESKKN